MIARAPGLTQLPPHWRALPLKFVATHRVSSVDKHSHDNEFPVRLCNYTDVYKHEFIDTDRMKLMSATATTPEIERFRLHVGDVVITKDSETWEDIGVPALMTKSDEDVVCGYHLAMLRANSEQIVGRYLFRCLQSKTIRLQLELSAKGVTRFGLPQDGIARLQLPVPPIEEQEMIADYLDRETSGIDDLIAEKHRMLKLMEEKRAALVTQAVTSGVNPDISLRISGIPWAKKTPEHWQLLRAKYLFRQTKHPVDEDDEIVTCYRNGEVTLRSNRREEGYTNAVLELGYQGIREGQLVLHSMDAFAGAIGVSDSNGKCSPEYINCDALAANTSNHYYAMLLRVMAQRGFILAACPAVRERAPRIRFSNFANMILPVPPHSEQIAILKHIDAHEKSTGELLENLRNSVVLLAERRGAIITAAVTGEISIEDMTA